MQLQLTEIPGKSAQFDRLPGDRRQASAPTAGNQRPGSKAAPGMQELATVGENGTVGLLNGRGVAADFDGHVARVVHANCLKAQILVSGFSVLAQHALNRLPSLGGFALGSHKESVRGEQGRRLIVVARVEGSREILGKPTNRRLYVQQWTGIRKTTAEGPVHSTTSWGKGFTGAPSAGQQASGARQFEKHSSAKVCPRNARVFHPKEASRGKSGRSDI